MDVIAEPVVLPHSALKNADWADRWTAEIEGRGLTAARAAELVFARPPSWVRWLMALRNAAVRPFGLKNAGHMEGRTGGFPVVYECPERIVLGFDDRHLDFRIVFDIASPGQRQRVSVTTLVNRHNVLGRIYIAFVTPFHRLIVRTMLARLASGVSSSVGTG